MIIEDTPIEGLKVIVPELVTDFRGYFCRVFCQNELAQLKENIVIEQINYSLTKEKGNVRGLHIQHPPHTEMKIVKCVKGKIFDVAVDLRKGSKTFLKWHGEVLSEENKRMLFIPEGFAHGLQALEDDSEIIYFNTKFYHPQAERGLRYNEPKVNVQWPLPPINVSEKDATNPLLTDDFEGYEV